MQLTIRLVPDADRHAYRAMLDDPAIARMTMTLKCPISVEEADARRLDTSTGDVASLFRGGLYDGETLVGEVGTFENAGGFHEIGYLIGRQYWGCGYASAAVPLIIAAIRDGGYKGVIEAGVYHDNPASLQVLRKNGFVITGDSDVFCRERGCMVAGVMLRLGG